MQHIKKCCVVLMAGFMLASHPVNAFNLNLSFLKSFNLQSMVQLFSKYHKATAIMASCTAVVGITGIIIACLKCKKGCAGQGLSSEDPKKFCEWVSKRLRQLEGKKVTTERRAQSRTIQQQQAQEFAADAVKELEKMCACLSSLWYRCSDDVYSRLNELYRTSFDGIQGLDKPREKDVLRYLSLNSRASYAQLCKAIQAKKELEKSSQNKTLSCIETSFDNQFSWQNYSAYLQGSDALSRLPQAREERLKKLRGRALELKKTYELILNSAIKS